MFWGAFSQYEPRDRHPTTGGGLGFALFVIFAILFIIFIKAFG